MQCTVSYLSSYYSTFCAPIGANSCQRFLHTNWQRAEIRQIAPTHQAPTKMTLPRWHLEKTLFSSALLFVEWQWSTWIFVIFSFFSVEWAKKYSASIKCLTEQRSRCQECYKWVISFTERTFCRKDRIQTQKYQSNFFVITMM